MEKQQVVIVDINIPFGSMVKLMVKWAIAAIPAFLIVYVLFFVLFVLPNFIPRL